MIPEYSPATRICYLFSNIILPIFLNACWFAFLISIYDATLPTSEARNVIFIISVILFYVSGASMVATYHRAIGFSAEPMNVATFFFILFAVVLYPLFFLLTLPRSLWYLCHICSSPTDLWNAQFDRCGASVDTLECNSCSECTCRQFCPGSLFGIWVGLYVLCFIVLGPIVFIVCFPLIVGPAGVALHFSLRSEIGVCDVFWLSLDLSHLWNALMYGLFSAIPALFVAIAYCVAVTPAFIAVFFAIAAAVVILFGAIPAIVMLFMPKGDQSVPGAVSRPPEEIHHIYSRNTSSNWWLF
jgi:hypothetical protein